jgi:hypothetical protein
MKTHEKSKFHPRCTDPPKSEMRADRNGAFRVLAADPSVENKTEKRLRIQRNLLNSLSELALENARNIQLSARHSGRTCVQQVKCISRKVCPEMCSVITVKYLSI